jgi:hypothetical protein
MDNVVTDKPNLTPETVPVQKVDAGLESIAGKMAAMKEMTLRNQMRATEQDQTGEVKSADNTTPVAPEGVKVQEDSDAEYVEPEVVESETESDEGNVESNAPEVQVSQEDTSNVDIIDFLDFAETHPNAKFKFKRGDKVIEIDAKKAASILGQGAAISEDARQLKIEKAEFDEYQNSKKAETDGLILAMEFTVQPRIQKAYDEIIKTQGYQNTFAQQLAATTDPTQQARIRANMNQNEQYIAQQSQLVNQLKPNVDEFMKIRKNQVSTLLENNRKNFKDKELRNKVIYDELIGKVAEGWVGANRQLVPGVDNIDLIASDEHLMSLMRDGLKYRDRPKVKSAGSSIAALTTRKGGTTINVGKQGDNLEDLRTKARGGDKKAADNLLVQQMNALRSQRNGQGRR